MPSPTSRKTTPSSGAEAINPPPYDECRGALVESGVPIVETTGFNPQPHLQEFHESDVEVLYKCTCVRHVLTAQSIGVDGISIDGLECTGYPGEDDIPGSVLIPAAAQVISIPMLASGGFPDGRGLVAVLALGADGVDMCTRGMCNPADIHPRPRQAADRVGIRA